VRQREREINDIYLIGLFKEAIKKLVQINSLFEIGYILLFTINIDVSSTNSCQHTHTRYKDENK
jgi:hypothetical protein